MEIKLYKFLNNANNKTQKNVLVVGVIHGDEPIGEFLIEEFLKNKTRTIKNNLFYIPRLNFSNERKNSSNVDINRNFPSKNWELTKKEDNYFGGFEPNSEIETKFLVNLTNEIKFDAIITIHTPYKIINYDGVNNPITLPLAKKISAFLNYPIEADIGYATPGSMGTYFGVERNIPIITIECDEEAKKEELYKKFEKLFYFLEKEF